MNMHKLRLFSLAAISAVLVGVLSPAAGLAGTYGSHKAPASAKKDIIQTAQSAKSFTTLLTALRVTGLTKTLKGAGPFTVFAPTDDAFAQLPAGPLAALLKDH